MVLSHLLTAFNSWSFHYRRQVSVITIHGTTPSGQYAYLLLNAILRNLRWQQFVTFLQYTFFSPAALYMPTYMPQPMTPIPPMELCLIPANLATTLFRANPATLPYANSEVIQLFTPVLVFQVVLSPINQ